MRRKGAKKEEKSKHLHVFVALIVVFLVLIFYLFYLMPIASRVFEVKFEIGSRVGVDGNRTALSFGEVIPGSVSTNKIFIGNEHDFPIEVRTSVSKSVRAFISIAPIVSVGAEQNYSLPVNLIIPENESFGEFKGTLRIDVFKQR